MDILCAVNETNRMIDFTAINPQVLDDIAEADTLADIVVVCPHWGTEYATVPSSCLIGERFVQSGDKYLGV